jgi:hypothetical protein
MLQNPTSSDGFYARSCNSEDHICELDLVNDPYMKTFLRYGACDLKGPTKDLRTSSNVAADFS